MEVALGKRKMNIGRLFLAGVPLVILLVTCSGCSSRGDDPVEVVKGFVEAWERLDEDKAGEYFCEEYGNLIKDDILTGLSEYIGLGFDDVKQIVEYQFIDMRYEEKSRDSDEAIVHITGSATVKLDGAKFKELAIKAIEARDGTISDEDLEAIDFSVPLISGLSQEFEVRGDVELIKEDGKWKICGDLSNVFDFHSD